jgi:hypothetical protein
MTGLFSILRPAGRWLATVLGLAQSRDRKGWLKLAALLLTAAAVLAYPIWYQPYQGADLIRELFASHMEHDAKGLNTLVFDHLDQAGLPRIMPPARTWVYPDLASFPGGLKDNFVVRWLGVIYIDQAGRYGIGAQVDDGLIICIDGKPVVHEWYQSGPHEVWGTVRLSEGPHAIDIRYLQLGGNAVLKMQWHRPGKNREPLPFEAMRPLKTPLPLGDIERLRLKYNLMRPGPSTYKPFTGGRFWRLPW